MAHSWQFDAFELIPGNRTLLLNRQPVAVGARAFDVLQALIERRDRLVSKKELLDVVWTGVVDDANLDGEMRTDQYAAAVLPELDNLRVAYTISGMIASSNAANVKPAGPKALAAMASPI